MSINQPELPVVDPTDVDFEWMDDLDPVEPTRAAAPHFVVVNSMRMIRKSKRIAGVLVPVEELKPVLVSGPVRCLDKFFTEYLEKIRSDLKYEYFELMASWHRELKFQFWDAWIPQSAEKKLQYARTTMLGRALYVGWVKLPAWDNLVKSQTWDEGTDERRNSTFMLARVPSYMMQIGSAASKLYTVARLVGRKADLELLATLDTHTFNRLLMIGKEALAERDPAFREAALRVGPPSFRSRPKSEGGLSQATTDAMQDALAAGYAVNHIAIATRALTETREKLLAKTDTEEEKALLRAKWKGEEARTLIRAGKVSGRGVGTGRGPDRKPRKRRTKAEIEEAQQAAALEKASRAAEREASKNSRAKVLGVGQPRDISQERYDFLWAPDKEES